MTMAKEGTLLIVDDNRSILAALRLLLEKIFRTGADPPTPNRLATTLREEQIDVILLDMNFTAGINTGNEGIYWLGEIHARRPDIKVVLFTAYADIDLAVSNARRLRWTSSSNRGTTTGWWLRCATPTTWRGRLAR